MKYLTIALCSILAATVASAPTPPNGVKVSAEQLPKLGLQPAVSKSVSWSTHSHPPDAHAIYNNVINTITTFNTATSICGNIRGSDDSGNTLQDFKCENTIVLTAGYSPIAYSLPGYLPPVTGRDGIGHGTIQGNLVNQRSAVNTRSIDGLSDVLAM